MTETSSVGSVGKETSYTRSVDGKKVEKEMLNY